MPRQMARMGFPRAFASSIQRDFRRIARGVDRAYFFVALLAVAGRIDVLASGQYKTGD